MSTKEDLLSRLSSNIPKEVVERNKPPAVVVDKSELHQEDIDKDYDYARSTYTNLIDKGAEAIDNAMELALASEHPRAYEVLSGMMKNVSDMTDKLMALHKARKEIESKKESAQQPAGPQASVTNNNVFVGTTTDLQRYILDQQKGVGAIDVDSK